MTRPKKILLGVLLLSGVSAAVLPVIAAEPAARVDGVTDVAWHGPGFDRRHGRDGRRDDGPARFSRDRDDRGGPHGFGGPGPRMGTALLEMFDANKDGSIGKDEVAAVTSGKVTTYDKDGDAALSLAEYQALWLEQMREQMVRGFQRHDRDGDGKVTEAELGRTLDRMVQMLDRNNDGTIDASELAGPRGPKGPGGPRGPGGPGGAGAPPPPPAE